MVCSVSRSNMSTVMLYSNTIDDSMFSAIGVSGALGASETKLPSEVKYTEMKCTTM